jgi:hypothetical protein
MIYRLYMAGIGQTTVNAAMTVGTEPCKSFIFDLANTDYVNFKRDMEEGKAELQDADGVVMTDAQEFVRGLP